VLAGCSTQKNTFVNRNYHNLTAHYNVYFNGKEAMKSGLKKIETQVEEDYTKVLPVYKESLSGTEKIVTSDMNTAIEKGTKLIKLHSITKPPKKKKNSRSRKIEEPKPDYNKWVDDAYLMMGRAYLYKKEYIMANSNFQTIIRKYKNDPVKYDGYLWYVRTLGESERYTEAQEVIQMLESDKTFPKNREGELAIVTADLHLKQQQFDDAIHYLDIGIKKINGNKRKSRYSFILGQLYQETGKKEQALEAYHQVIRRRPEYSLLFNAQIKSAEVLSGSGNVSTLRKELNRMSKKKWNEPYLDQIYYALGNISFNEGKMDDAIKLYQKSVAVSKTNIHQKALSSLTLGEIYFDQKKYIPAGCYYDTAMVSLDEKYPNYESISKKYTTLSKLVENLKTVQTQDSLQRLAKMDKAQLDNLIAGWIATEKKKQEAEMGNESESDMSAAYYSVNSNRMRLNSSSSSFYFYNTSTVSYGKKEFLKLWGERKNEDDWRRLNKSVSGSSESEGPETELAEELKVDTTRVDDPLQAEYYLQDIPSDDSLMKVSHLKIRDALFNGGSILKTDFNDFENSVGCFTSLDKRYPENIYELSSYFNLWDLYKSLGKPDSSNYYRDLILQKYPNSNYAKYLVNPNFFVEEAARKDSMNKLYAVAYASFRKNDWNNTWATIQKVQQMSPDSALSPKVQFIQTIAANKDLSGNRLADSLQAYIKKYPKAEPTPVAEKIVALIKEDKFSNYEQLVTKGYLSDIIKNNELLPQNLTSDTAAVSSKWDTNNELLHYFIIAYPNDNQIDINRLKYDIANYNIDHYPSLDFEIETENLNSANKLIIVRNFDNKESAMIYFLSIIRKPDVFKTLAGKPYINFIVSNNNYRQMLSDQSYDEYLAYFVKNYSKLTTGKFSDKELETPEELMAKIKADSTTELKEQGKYVVVETNDKDYIPVKKEQLFDPDYSKPHGVTIVVNQKNAGTGYLMRDLIKYNTANYKNLRLRVIPGRMKEATLLTISSFSNAYEAYQYSKAIASVKDLFNSLGSLKYDIYTMSDQNLKKLVETENMEEWGKFYQTYFIRRTPPAPVKAENTPATKTEESKTTETPATEQKTITTPAEAPKEQPAKPVEQPQAAPKEASANAAVVPVPAKDTTSVTKAVTVSADTVAAKKATEVAPVPEKTAAPESAVQAGGITQQETVAPQVKEKFPFNPESGHNLIYMLPAKSPNQNLLNTYLNRLIAMKYRAAGIEMVNEPLDDFRVLVIIKGFKNKEAAAAFYKDAQADQRVSMSLRNLNYKSYLISNENLQTVKESKDIAEYQKFYEKNY